MSCGACPSSSQSFTEADLHYMASLHVLQAVMINPAFAFPLVTSYDKHGADLVVSGKREGVLAGNSRSALPSC
jgi:hypothetical protein